MLVKDDVLSEFRNVRSYERVDLLCSLLDLCLPYELRFLGTCLEFLGKRDFYELREDERHANNVNHISQFRSLLDENTRRKLVLYVSLLNSCNSDCANCLNETLTALCISDVSQICQSEPENAEKVLDELLLLYTIAVKHPAFNLHQKTEFAAHLSRLEEEDKKLSLVLYPNEDEIQRFCKPSDSIPDTPCQLKGLSSSSIEDQENSSHSPVISQENHLTCHVLSGSVYTNAVLPSSLNQASASCLNPTHVMVSSMCGHSNTCADNSHSPETASRLNAETGHSVIAMGLTASPVSSSLVMAPGLVMPVAPSTSHCLMPTSGELNLQKGHPNLLAPMMVPSEPLIMPYPGHAPWPMMVPIQGHISAAPLACPCPTAPASSNVAQGLTVSSAMTSSKPVSSSGLTALSSNSVVSSTSKPLPVSCSTYCISLPSSTTVSSSSCYISASPIITPKENCAKTEESERQGIPSSSPIPEVTTTPPPSHKIQVPNHSKGHSIVIHHAQQHIQQTVNPGISQTPQSSNQTQVMFASTQQPSPPQSAIPQTSKPDSNSVNQSSLLTNTPPHSQSSQHVPSKLPIQHHSNGDNLREVIVREMPKYKTNLQDFSPDELLHMGDDKLKDIGLSPRAVQQLRSIMRKLHSTNGINCVNRSETTFQNENSGSRRRHFHDKTAIPLMQGVGVTNSGYAVPTSVSGTTNNSTSNGTFHKGNKRHQHIHLTNQVRALQLEDDCRRPCSNSSSTSDCSSGSHSPPETPSLPNISEVPSNHHFDQGYSGKESGAEFWSSGTIDDKNREDHDRVMDEKTRNPMYQPAGVLHTAISRSRGLSKAPPGIPTIPRGRGQTQGHPMVDKNRRDPVGPLNGVPPEMGNPSPYTMSGATGLPSNVPYSSPAVSSFLPHSPFPTMHTFHRFQPSSFLHAAGTTSYPFPPNGEMWTQFHQPPQPTQPFITPIVAFSPAHPPPKLSCYNCGRQGHQGSDCKESTFEEITQQGQYHLDYKPYKDQGDVRDTEKQPYT